MTNKEDFVLTLKSLGFRKTKELLLVEFSKHRNIELARKQHWWLKLRYPNDCATLFFENLIKLEFYEESLFELNKIVDKVYIFEIELVKNLIKLRSELKRNVVNAKHIYKLHAFSIKPLTKYGLENLEAVLELIESNLEQMYPNGLLEEFYIVDEKGNCLTTHNKEYYFKYFELCKIRNKELEKFKKKRGRISNDDMAYIIGSACANLLRESENKLRESIGAKLIGEGFISETELYYKIKTHFAHLKVIQHGRPNFLERQHYDIWIPEKKVAIEYHGIQHDKPIDYFGGEIAFQKNIERDALKREKSIANNISLLEVRPGYNIHELIIQLEHLLK